MPQPEDLQDKRHPIQVVSRRAGLSVHVLRAWEKRYEAVLPERSSGGRRLYSDQDIERLRLMRAAIAAGRRIGDIANLGLDNLRALVNEDLDEERPADAISAPAEHAQQTVEAALAAIRALDGTALRLALSRALIALPPGVFIEEVARPVLHRVGALWARDELTPGHEHLATTVFRRLLGEIVETLQPGAAAPLVVVATPARQRHELGAMLAAMSAALEGWRVVFLGGDLPARDIAQAARARGARAVALSITTPDGGAPAEVEGLRDALEGDVPILLGGQGAGALRADERRGIHVLADLRAFAASLRRYAGARS
jgi:DNA-binding transcriptional MerR regulator/methylmalonyl-CoA mutase cobalamin-binding subunit